MADDVFLSLIPRDTSFIGNVSESIRLRVIQSDGVDIEPDIRFNKVDLNTGEKWYDNNSSPYYSFSIIVMIHKDDKIGDVSVINALNYYIQHGIKFYVNTRAIGLESNVLYLVTENKSRKQTSESGYVKWSLTFTRYEDVAFAKFKNTNKTVTKAVNKYNYYKLPYNERLRLCNRKLIVYSPNKKTFVKCVKVVQQILYQKGFLKGKYSDVVHGWYDKVTKNAIKAYQKKYAKDGLIATGNMSPSTFNHMCGIPNQVGETKIVTGDLPVANSDGVIDMTGR